MSNLSCSVLQSVLVDQAKQDSDRDILFPDGAVTRGVRDGHQPAGQLPGARLEQTDHQVGGGDLLARAEGGEESSVREQTEDESGGQSADQPSQQISDGRSELITQRFLQSQHQLLQQ